MSRNQALTTYKKGGIHPAEYKLTDKSPVQILPLPEKVTILLSQHIGVPAIPVVSKGDTVKVGQLIAQGIGFVSANIHSSVSGKVVKIDSLPDLTGYKKPAIVIEVEGDDWEENIIQSTDLLKDITLSKDEILEKIRESGIVGLGGAAFPSHVKLILPRDKNAEALIINGVECEPYLTSDHRLMLEYGEEMMVGIRLLMKVLNVRKTMIGIENNKADAVYHLKDIASKFPGIEVYPLKVKYPQGSEKQLIEALTDREVPSRKLPVDVGVIVHNVSTAYAVYEAVQKNKPLINRIVTVSGKSLKKPSNFVVRIGTSVRFLIEAAGGLPENTGKVISGGLMMGKALNSLDVPVIKGMSGILVLSEDETKRKPIETCIRCSKCVTVCPMGLEPYLLMSLTQNGNSYRLEKEMVLDCLECGSCSYICPANRPLLDYIRLGKTDVNKIIRERKYV
ncbi:MAG: electron transport complex subunit RsxC [Bacteroidales bacterium]|nr:electron transport complex subunit RsxC [Bacteroidales bacterium]